MKGQRHHKACSFLIIYPDTCFLAGLRDLFVSQNAREIYKSHSSEGFQFLYVPLNIMVKFQLLAQFPNDKLLHPIKSSFILLSN